MSSEANPHIPKPNPIMKLPAPPIYTAHKALINYPCLICHTSGRRYEYESNTNRFIPAYELYKSGEDGYWSLHAVYSSGEENHLFTGTLTAAMGNSMRNPSFFSLSRKRMKDTLVWCSEVIPGAYEAYEQYVYVNNNMARQTALFLHLLDDAAITIFHLNFPQVRDRSDLKEILPIKQGDPGYWLLKR